MFAFTLSIDDFVISFFTTGSGVSNLSIYVYSMAKRGISPEINALSTLMILTVTLLLFIINRRSNKKTKTTGEREYEKTVWILCAILLLVTSLVGCGQSDVKKLYVYNWGTYIDNSVLRDFEKENNCKVVYENYASNEEMYYKLKSGNANYDVIFPSDYMIEKMIKEDMLLPLDKQNIPNLKNIDPKLLDIPFDPGNQYSIPYFWGTLGILYNTEKVTKPVDSWNILWDKEYAKKILMDSQRVGIALILQGYSLNSTNQDELNKAYELLVEQNHSCWPGVNDQVIDMMIGNEADLAVVIRVMSLLHERK